MSRTTRTSRGWSPASDRAFILTPERSRALLLWWAALHALIVASFVASGLPPAVEAIAAGSALVHAVLRRPLPATPVHRCSDGAWSLPERGLLHLTLVHATVGPFSILLRFAPGKPLCAEPNPQDTHRRCRAGFCEDEVFGQPGAYGQGEARAPARPFSVLLLRDQLDDAAWRALQAELRRAKPLPRFSHDSKTDSF